MPLPLLAAVPGLIKAGASLFGRGKRKREQKAAQAQFDNDSAAVRNFEFTNQYKGLENTAEDLTVNQDAANFEASQTDKSLASGLDAITASGGGGGGAQAIADAALEAGGAGSAKIALQEQQNQQLRAQQAAQNQQLEAGGAERVEGREFGLKNQLQDQSGERLGAANASIQQAKSAFASGLGSAGGALVGGGLKGVFGGDKGGNGQSGIGKSLQGLFG